MVLKECPGCGAHNASERAVCYVCGAALAADAVLSQEPAAPQPQAGTCVDCAHITCFPPPGKHIGKDEVWCTQRSEAVATDQPTCGSFAPAFGWSRDQTLG
jgi:hypothetical protein